MAAGIPGLRGPMRLNRIYAHSMPRCREPRPTFTMSSTLPAMGHTFVINGPGASSMEQVR